MKRDDDRQGTMVRLDEYLHAYTLEKKKTESNVFHDAMLCNRWKVQRLFSGESQRKFQEYIYIYTFASVIFKKQYVYIIIYHHLKNVKTMRWIVMIEYWIDEIYDWSLWHAHAWALRPMPSSFSGSSVETNFFVFSLEWQQMRSSIYVCEWKKEATCSTIWNIVESKRH